MKIPLCAMISTAHLCTVYPHPHFTENPTYVFPKMKLRGLVPSSNIHVLVGYLYISRIGLPIWLQQNRQTDPEIAHRYMNVEIWRQNIILILFLK